MQFIGRCANHLKTCMVTFIPPAAAGVGLLLRMERSSKDAKPRATAARKQAVIDGERETKPGVLIRRDP